MVRHRLITGGVAVLAMIFSAPDANGKLLIDIRGPGGMKQMALRAADLGKPIKLDVCAQVTGRRPNSPEALSMVQGSFVSQGTTLGDINPAGDLGEFTNDRVCAREPFNGNGASPGTIQDIDGDGDLDLGGKDGAPNADWVVFRTDIANYGAKPGQGIPIPGGREFFVGAITFTPAQLGGDTWIRFLPKTDEMGVVTLDAGLWMEDGGAFTEYIPEPIDTSGFLLVVPEPAVLPLVGAGTLLICARRKRSWRSVGEQASWRAAIDR